MSFISLTQRFWSKVEFGLGCWTWQGYIDRKGHGYGGFRWKKNDKWIMEKAHRVSWLLSKGPIPTGMFVCHHCDNKICVRPDHLFLGTQADNLRDAGRKGHMKRANYVGKLNPNYRHGRRTKKVDVSE